MEKLYKVELTEAELHIIAEGLGELPLKKSMAVLQKINEQFSKQRNEDDDVNRAN